MEYRKLRVMISGGGTGGHIFPALSIAGKLKEVNPDTEILFVGAKGRMEMEKVPAAGYEIVGLPIAGLQRKLTLSNLALPLKVIRSVRMAEKLIRSFRPDIVIGVGGYASAPLLYAAGRLNVPTLIQEQNGYAGLTNRILGKRAARICVAYEGMEKFFPAERIVLTGNPIRGEIVPADERMREQAYEYYGLNPAARHILILGGSLGSGTLNRAMEKWIEDGCPAGENVEVLWQCGKYYKAAVDGFMKDKDVPGIRHTDFIGRMDLAYAAADVVISRSGASSVSELCAARKAVIFVPSPNVAEDHQTHNAMALAGRDAALMVRDSEACGKLMGTACTLVNAPERIRQLEDNIAAMARIGAAMDIITEIYNVTSNNTCTATSIS